MSRFGRKKSGQEAELAAILDGTDALTPAGDATLTQATDNALIVPLSSWDFLEGRFRAASQTRVLNVAVAGVTVLALSASALLAIGARASANQAEMQQQALQEQVDMNSAVVQQLEADGSITRSAADAHVTERLAQAQTALVNSVDYPRIINDLAALGSGIKVTTITFGATGAPEGGATTETTTAPPTTAPADAAPAPLAGGLGTIEITGTAPDAATSALVATLLGDQSRFPYLVSNGTGVTNTCAAECTWSWSGTLGEAGRSSRAAEIAAEYATNAPGAPAQAPINGGEG